MKLVFPFLFFLALAVGLSAQKKGKNKLKYNYLSYTKDTTEIKAVTNKLERFYYSFTGHFHNTKQADTSTQALFKHQELLMIPMWTKQRVGEYWLYMTWCRLNMVEAPMGQFVFKVSKLNRDTFIIERYDFPDEIKDKIGNSWAQENAFANLKPQDLIKTSCAYHVVPDPKCEFKITLLNDLETCPTSTLAAKTKGSYKYSEYNIAINLGGITVFNTGYDENKKVVVTYLPNGNHFERQPKDQPKYMDILYPKLDKK